MLLLQAQQKHVARRAAEMQVWKTRTLHLSCCLCCVVFVLGFDVWQVLLVTDSVFVHKWLGLWCCDHSVCVCCMFNVWQTLMLQTQANYVEHTHWILHSNCCTIELPLTAEDMIVLQQKNNYCSKLQDMCLSARFQCQDVAISCNKLVRDSSAGLWGRALAHFCGIFLCGLNSC
jgi:hypothetical protein